MYFATMYFYLTLPKCRLLYEVDYESMPSLVVLLPLTVYLFVSVLLLYQSVIIIDVPNKWASACVQPAIADG